MLKLREYREKAGLRQVDVAKKLNVDQAAVSKWENGENQISRKYHRKLARLYGVSVDELFSDNTDTVFHGASVTISDIKR